MCCLVPALPRPVPSQPHLLIPHLCSTGKQETADIPKYSLNKMKGSTLLGLIFILSIFTLMFSTLIQFSILLCAQQFSENEFFSSFFSFDAYFWLNCLFFCINLLIQNRKKIGMFVEINLIRLLCLSVSLLPGGFGL